MNNLKEQIHGIQILRAYELSWLSPNGKPELALLEIVQDFGQPIIDTWALKQILEGLTNKKFADLTALQDALNTYITTGNISLISHSEFNNIIFFEQANFDSYSSTRSLGLRFICPQSNQPYVGRVNLLIHGNESDKSAEITRVINSVRNLCFTPQTLAQHLFVTLREVIPENLIVSIHLNRRGGISYQAILGSIEQDYSLFSHRSILE